jgi:Ca-activated chloride channel family protein
MIYFVKKRNKTRFLKFFDERFYEYSYHNFSFFHWNLKNALLVTALFFMIIAAAGPKWNKELQIVKKEGIDIVICLDTSKSMDAEDIKPNRLQRAKDQISLFIDQLKGDRVAIVAFAGKSFIQCPLTDDYGAAEMFLHNIDSDTVPYYGTNIGEALNNAASLFNNSQKYKVVILVSDGEDLEKKAIETAKKLKKNGIIIYSLGIGSPQGTTIPVKNKNGDIEYAKDDKGNIILSKLDVTTLTKLANVTDGKFYAITPRQSEIFDILKKIGTIEKSKYSSKEFARYKNQYRYFLFVALLLILIEMFILYNKKEIIKRTI